MSQIGADVCGAWGNPEDFSQYVIGLSDDKIGPYVGSGSIAEEILVDITAICRRRFKKKDVLVYVDTDEGREMESGIVFTASAIVTWSNQGEIVVVIPYEEIESVDFDEEEVLIEFGGKSTTLYLGEDAEAEKYPRYMYNFIMDILEYDADEKEE
ncbi:MAG: hypothetical protein ACI39H_03735 [Lachnospiraceae bacterium]